MKYIEVDGLAAIVEVDEVDAWLRIARNISLPELPQILYSVSGN